ncbi:RFC1 [Cordylochernes scorpioides]|uniref:Replication factor C subunit 1 n=1 Tax=Cordylochernes scorpioides TaxID=51811 RepID=A0ABY6JYW3_9ARAC|nr:RFC1 [Cordylochernes scorpioides]
MLLTSLHSDGVVQPVAGCLTKTVFVLSGVLDCIERDEAKTLIEQCGGKVTQSISKNTSYLVAGPRCWGQQDGQGEFSSCTWFVGSLNDSVLQAQKLGTTILDEDQFFQLLEAKTGSKHQQDTKESAKKSSTKKEEPKPSPSKKSTEVKTWERLPVPKVEPPAQKKKLPASTTKQKAEVRIQTDRQRSAEITTVTAQLWVDKYKPQSSKQIIGQQGAKSNVVKLTAWLANWDKNRANKPGRWSLIGEGVGCQVTAQWWVAARLGDDGAVFRAALLSGPPGIGKTTTAQLVCKEKVSSFWRVAIVEWMKTVLQRGVFSPGSCSTVITYSDEDMAEPGIGRCYSTVVENQGVVVSQELGYDTVEFNASDTRSKKSLQQEIMELLSSQSLAAFAGGSLPQAVSKKHAVIMDEVDGMAGNEDRGGMQELIALIKATQVPILCICNNRSHPKVLSLSRYCFDLRFSRPRTEQIRGAMMSVAYKEGMKVGPQALADLIESSNHDVRQVLHSLSLMAASQSAVSSESVKADIGRGLKDLKLPSTATAVTAAASLNILCTQCTVPSRGVGVQGDKLAHLRLLSEVADSLTDGDLVERQIRSQNSWSLLPVQAVYSSVVPGELLRGHLGGQISFPTWLGRNSAHGKNRRLAQQLQLHTRLRTSASCVDLAMDYLPRGLRDQLLGPTLAEGDVTPTLELMQHYYLQRDDLDAISLLTQWPGRGADPLQQLPPKVKAALTRAFNKEGFLVPYATMSLRKTKARQTTEEEGEEEEVDSEEDDLANDAMIKLSCSEKNAAGVVAYKSPLACGDDQ